MVLTDKEIARLKDRFKEHDGDGNGWISVSELPKLLQSLGQNPCAAERMEIMKKFDANKDGHLDFAEFVTFWAAYDKKHSKEEADQELLDAFMFFDKDHNGSIDKHELSKVLTCVGKAGDRMTKEEVDEMFKIADADGNGKIEYKEFVQIFAGHI